MAFDEVVVSPRTAAKARASTICIWLDKRRDCPASAVVTIGAEVWVALGLYGAESFALMIGRGPDQGRIRLEKRAGGSVLVMPQRVRNGGGFYRLSLGHRPEFPDRAERTVPVDWKIIEDGKAFEITLPSGWFEPPAPMKNVAKEAATAPRGKFRADLGLCRSAETVLEKLVEKRGKFVPEPMLRRAMTVGQDGLPLVAVLAKIRKSLPVTVWITFAAGKGYQLQGKVGDILANKGETI